MVSIIVNKEKSKNYSMQLNLAFMNQWLTELFLDVAIISRNLGYEMFVQI